MLYALEYSMGAAGSSCLRCVSSCAQGTVLAFRSCFASFSAGFAVFLLKRLVGHAKAIFGP